VFGQSDNYIRPSFGHLRLRPVYEQRITEIEKTSNELNRKIDCN
jgi:hypothetical protein